METLEIKNENATCIKIPDTITHIDYNKAFLCCDKLECIECDSDYFKSIDGVLFTADYKTLVRYPSRKKGVSYIIPESVINIEQCAFKDCRSLENIVLPNSLISIGERAFLNCSSLQKIIFPDSLTSIGWNAFYGCKKMQKVVLPDFLANIEGAVFAFCSDLESIECNSAFYKSIDGVLFTADYKTLVCYPSKKQDVCYIVPESVTHIGNFAFFHCESLETIILPNALINIGWCSFSNCSYLRNVKLPSSLIKIGESVFSFCKSLREIYLPNSVTEIGNCVFDGCAQLRTVTLSDSLTSIPEGAFYYCSKLKEIILPDSVKHIGENAFRFCESLQDVKLTENIVSVDSHAFDGCKSLEKIKLPNSIQSIGNMVFAGCTSLEEIECNNDCYKSIDGVLFDIREKRCICYPTGKMRREYVIPDGTLIIEESAFDGCYELKNLVLPDSITTLEANALFCPRLKKISIPHSIRKIGSAALRGCSCLVDIECDNGYYKSIDGVLFTADLKKLICCPLGKIRGVYTIPEIVTEIDPVAFRQRLWDNCFDKIILSKNIHAIDFLFQCYTEKIECDSEYYKSIDGVLFTADCKTLVCYPEKNPNSTYSIPDSVTRIAKQAFRDCQSLISITFPDSLTEIDELAFECYNLRELIVPIGCRERFELLLPNLNRSIFKEQ